MNPFSLAYREQQQLFIYSGDYVTGILSDAGGVSTLAGRFLVQFFVNPAAAFFITLCCLALLCWVLRRHFPAVLAAVLMLAASLSDVLLHFDIVPAMLFAALALGLYEKSSGKVIVGPVLTAILFPLAGSASFLFALCAFASGAKKYHAPGHFCTGNILSGAATLVTSLIVAWIAYLALAVPDIFTALSPAFFYDVAEEMPPAHWAMWFSFPACILISSILSHIKVERVRAITAASLVLICLPFAYRYYSRFAHGVPRSIYKLEHYAARQDWPRLEKAAEPLLSYPIPANYFYLARAQQGILGKDLMKRHHNGPYDLIYIPKDKSANPAMPHVLFFAGNMAGAQSIAYNLLFATSGYNPTMLKILAEIELMRGSYEVAGKYLDILSHSLFYHRWAKRRKAFLYDDALVESDPVLGRGRRDFPTEDGFSVYDSPVAELRRVIRNNGADGNAMQYCLYSLLLAKDLPGLVGFIDELWGVPALRSIPAYVQEALLFFTDYQRNVANDTAFRYLDSDWCLSHGVEPSTFARFEDFQQETLRASGKAPARYRNTFWHYLLYDNVTAAEIAATASDGQPVN